jgi:hypothetical protein
VSDYEYQGQKLTGIVNLKNKFPGQTAIMCCSGTTFLNYDDRIAPRSWKRFAINETIRYFSPAGFPTLRNKKLPAVGGGTKPDFWVLSDDPIVHEYGEFCTEDTTVLCMHQATRIVRRGCKAKTIYTVESMPKPGRYENGYQFFSRGTVLIGAIEMARWMGFTRFFVFGLDCYRLKDQYYYDGRTPGTASELHIAPSNRITSGMPPGIRGYIMPRQKMMVTRLQDVSASGLWKGLDMWCVGSPWSRQQTIPKMEWETFKGIADKEIKGVPKSAPEPVPVPIPDPTPTVEPILEPIIEPEPIVDASVVPVGTIDVPRRRPGRPRKNTEEVRVTYDGMCDRSALAVSASEEKKEE